MADFRNIYKLTSLIQDKSNITDDLVMAITDDIKQIRFPKEKEIISDFMKNAKSTRYNTERIIEVTIKHGYIERILRPTKNQDDRLMVTYDKGHDLLYRINNIKVGLYAEEFGHYSSFSLLISFLALALAIASCIISLVK